ncbi:MAG: hypothetical protein R3Y28_07975 [Candidatus Gastranaerophilales bacterium]
MTDNYLKIDRNIVANIIQQVLIGKIPVREAIMSFPKDSDDESVIASYHALVHYEADEDLRKRDAIYKQEQDDYLEMISVILEKGEVLPDNIIKGYRDFYKSASIPHANNSKGFWNGFWKFLNIDNKKL